MGKTITLTGNNDQRVLIIVSHIIAISEHGQGMTMIFTTGEKILVKHYFDDIQNMLIS